MTIQTQFPNAILAGWLLRLLQLAVSRNSAADGGAAALRVGQWRPYGRPGLTAGRWWTAEAALLHTLCQVVAMADQPLLQPSTTQPLLQATAASYPWPGGGPA